MKKLSGFTIALAFFSLTGLSLAGCYKRTTAPTYDFDPSEVTKIREQLGAITSEKEFINEEEEEDD